MTTITRTPLANGKFRYEVDGEVHTAESRRVYEWASLYKVEEQADYDHNKPGTLVAFLHTRADLAEKGNADGNHIAKSGKWSRVPGAVEITEASPAPTKRRRRSTKSDASSESKSSGSAKDRKSSGKSNGSTDAHPLAHKVGRPLTASSELFASWIEDQTGYTPDRETLQLVRSLVGEFQRSEVNQKRMKAEAASRK